MKGRGSLLFAHVHWMRGTAMFADEVVSQRRYKLTLGRLFVLTI